MRKSNPGDACVSEESRLKEQQSAQHELDSGRAQNWHEDVRTWRRSTESETVCV
jgi:hypothetical protein